jgi:hypothetical protein
MVEHTERMLVYMGLGGVKLRMFPVINRLQGSYWLLVMGYWLWVIEGFKF